MNHSKLYLRKDWKMNEITSKILKIGKMSVKEAQKESLKKGIANVYSKNRQLFFQLPDGTITQNIPKEYQEQR